MKSLLYYSTLLWTKAFFLLTENLLKSSLYLKKGDKSPAEHYRPLSLTCISCKLLEHIVHSTIMDFLDSFNLLIPLQHGYHQNMSCESKLLTTLRDLSHCLNCSSQRDAVLLDFSKASNCIDHRLLPRKLHILMAWHCSGLV